MVLRLGFKACFQIVAVIVVAAAVISVISAGWDYYLPLVYMQSGWLT